MNIAFVNEFAGYVGGVEQNIAHCARALRQRGHRCSLVYQKQTYQALEYLKLFDTVHQGFEALECVRADAFYLHRVESVAPFLALPQPLIRMVHDHDLCCPRRHKYDSFRHRPCHHAAGWRCWLDLAFVEKRGHRFRFKNLLSHRRELHRNQKLDRLLVASRSMQQELLMNGFPESQLSVLPPTVPVSELSPTIPAPSEPIILYVGQMIRGKGPDLLLRSLARLEQPFRAVMVGRGNYLDSLRNLSAQLGLEGKVEWKGWVAPEKLDQLYRQARLVAVPSRWPEPFGMVGLEAMRRARPVVAYAVGGIPDWLQHGVSGFLIKPPSIQEFSQALDLLLGNPELATHMGREGLELARTQFDFDNYITNLEGLLEREIRKEPLSA